MKNILIALAAAATLAAPAAAAPDRAAAPAAQEEVRIPFVNFGGVYSFHADQDDVVYLQDRHRNWYRAQLYGPCFGLPFAIRIGIDTHGSSTFDRFSRLIVDGETCPIESLTRSARPEKRAKAKRHPS
jgi:hypothetical protein